MAKAPQSRLLEVRLIALKPDRWEWQVCEGDTPIVMGYETTRETAQIKGDSALFLLLSTGRMNMKRERYEARALGWHVVRIDPDGTESSVEV